MARLDSERQKKLEPSRIDFAEKELLKKGIQIISKKTTEIQFVFKNELVKFYPYSGWHTGKTIKDGRGLKNLLKQL